MFCYSYIYVVFNTSAYKSEWGAKGEADPDMCKYRGYR